MKKLTILLVALFTICSFAAVTMTQAEASKKKGGKVTGEVTAVDAQAKTVTVKSKDKEVTLMVTDKTMIKEGKEKKTLADVQSGVKVTAKFSEEGDKMTAKEIHIEAGKKAAPKQEMAAPAPAPAPEKK